MNHLKKTLLKIQELILTDKQEAHMKGKVLKIKFATVPRLAVGFYKKNYITKNQIGLIISELQSIGRYSNQIIQKMKEDSK